MFYIIEKSQLAENNGNIVLGNTYIDIETEDGSLEQVELVAKTKKGWVSKKKVVVEKAIVIGDHPEYEDCVLIDPKQAESLIALFNRKDCKQWCRNNSMDVTTAFALAGNKYGWIYDRIDEIG